MEGETTMLVTSAGAHKLLKRFQEEKEHLLVKERQNNTYVLSDGETDVEIPEYDFNATNQAIKEIDEKIIKLKHAINLSNVTNKIVTSSG